MKMKRILGLFLALVMFMGCMSLKPIASYANDDANGEVEINKTNFPDYAFKDYLESQYDSNNDHKLDHNELDRVTEILISRRDVVSLKGIRYFKNLKKLDCSENYLKKLDVSNNPNLTDLNCGNNWLTSLDVSKNTNLNSLACSGNQLTELNVSNNPNLTGLWCDSDNLTSLNLGDITNLTKLSCNENSLTRLDVSKNTNLTQLWCSHNKLTRLYVSRNTNLTDLGCDHNELTHLEVSNNTGLTKLSCSYNLLTVLDVSDNTNIAQLRCDHNKDLTELYLTGGYFSPENTKLTELCCDSTELGGFNLDKCPGLTKLNCSNSQLTGLDVSNNRNLTNLVCNGNALRSLDVSNNTDLTELQCTYNKLESLDVRKNTNLTQLWCSHNNLTSLDVTNNKKLQDFGCNDQQYNITVNRSKREFNYSKFPGRFNKDKVTSQVGASFNANALTVNSDTPSEVTYKYKVGNNTEMNVKLNVAYEFNPGWIVSIKVKTQPRKLCYTAGESLDLTGLEVTLTDDRGVEKDVYYTDFGRYNITAQPENNAELKLGDNGKTVTLSGQSPSSPYSFFPRPIFTAETKALTVNPKEYTVTFKDGDKTQTVKVETGKAIDTDTLADQSMPKNPMKAGYTFKEWNTKENGKGETFTGTSVVNGDMTVHAIYTQDFVPTPSQTPTPAPKLQPETLAPKLELKPQPAMPAPKPQPETLAPKSQHKAPAPKLQPETQAPKPEPKPQPETLVSTPTPTQAPKLQPETPAPTPESKPQPEKRIGVISKKDEIALFVGVLAVLGFSIAGFAIFRKKKMMGENNK